MKSMGSLITFQTKHNIIASSYSHATTKKGNNFQFETSYYLTAADYYSLWREVYSLNQPTTSCVIDEMKQSFSRHEIPDQLISDNGSQYSSKQFHQFTKERGFIYTTSSCIYPRSNGLAEQRP